MRSRVSQNFQIVAPETMSFLLMSPSMSWPTIRVPQQIATPQNPDHCTKLIEKGEKLGGTPFYLCLDLCDDHIRHRSERGAHYICICWSLSGIPGDGNAIASSFCELIMYISKSIESKPMDYHFKVSGCESPYLFTIQLILHRRKTSWE
jgi:hypothetical protein